MFRKILKKANESASIFNIFDWAFFKICLIGIGILLGAYFHVFFMKYIKIVGIIALLAYVYIMYALLMKKYDSEIENKQVNNNLEK